MSAQYLCPTTYGPSLAVLRQYPSGGSLLKENEGKTREPKGLAIAGKICKSGFLPVKSSKGRRAEVEEREVCFGNVGHVVAKRIDVYRRVRARNAHQMVVGDDDTFSSGGRLGWGVVLSTQDTRISKKVQ